MRAFHPVANLFPLMVGEDFESLEADIAKNGLLESIWLHPDGSILDGRNRYRACKALHIEPRYKTWDGKNSAVDFVLSMNLHRRHLNETQRAIVANRLANIPKHLHKTDAPVGASSQEDAATALGVSRRTVQRIASIEREAPDLIPAMEAGELLARKAERVVRDRNRQPAGPLPPGKYRVIYADPPWEYSNSGFAQSAAAHYPTMSQEELCALPVGELAHSESVLFLWATSPLLPEALEVMAAWGFEYKASRVWVKDKAPGIGWFVRTRHEFLLIGVRGSGMHPSQKLDSVMEYPVTQHSVKPKGVHEDIENCYGGPYIELFARTQQNNWEVWGDEIQRQDGGNSKKV